MNSEKTNTPNIEQSIDFKNKGEPNIQTILDKIQQLPISPDDKALLMKQFKYNIMNPSQGEDQSLEHIHNKYLYIVYN